MLSKEHKFFLEHLYWKIYGNGHIINNELYLWLVKGWMVENKGHLVNWVEVAIATIREKA
jgi:hypothetical protein